MDKCKRFRYRWTIKECLDLQREFELLKLSIDEIALKHQRTPNAIMLKLDEQGIAEYHVLYNNYHGITSPLDIIRKHTHDEFDDENIVNNFIDEDDSDDEEYIEDEETIADDESNDDLEEQDENYSLHKRINDLENHVTTLTELVFKLKHNTNKSVFSLFG